MAISHSEPNVPGLAVENRVPAAPQPAPASAVDLTLYVAQVPRADDDPPRVQHRMVVLYGEGQILPGVATASLKAENLADGLRILRVTNSWDEISARLCAAEFDHRLSRDGDLARYEFGLILRPPVWGRTSRSGPLLTPARRAAPLYTFVRTDKIGLVHRLSAARSLIKQLESTVHLQLRSDDRAALGNVVIAGRPAKRVDWTVEPKVDPKEPHRSIRLVRDEELRQRRIHVNLRAFARDQLVVADALVVLEPGDEPPRVPFTEAICSVHLRAWMDGVLIADDQKVLNLDFAGTISMNGSSITVVDRIHRALSRSAVASKAAREGLRTETVARRDGYQTQMAVRSGREPWDTSTRDLGELFELAPPDPPEGTFFERGMVGRAKAINHFANAINAAGVAIIADPFFDLDSAQALFPRISRPEIELTVITNLRDDETGGGSAVDQLRKWFSVARPHFKLTLLRVTRSNDSLPSFHDRFVVTQRRGADPTGFLLSNSFSGMASKFPLFVSALAPGATAAAIADIDRLQSGDDQMLVETIWPLPPDEEPIRSQIVHWRARERADRHLPRMPVVASQHSKLRRRGAGRGGRDRQRSKSIRSIGGKIATLGELRARGLELDIDRVVRAVPRWAIPLLVRFLRRTFALPRDPTVLDGVTTHREMSLRQGMQPEALDVETCRYAAAVWVSGFLQLPTRALGWGRPCVFAVIAYIDPLQAVRLAEQLLDPALLSAAVDTLHRFVHRWPAALSTALLHSRSAMLRAMGAFAIAAESDRGGHANDLRPPTDVTACVRELEASGISAAEISVLLLRWGSDARDARSVEALAFAFAEAVCRVADETVLADLAAGLRNAHAFSDAVIRTIAAAAAPGHVGLLRGVVEDLAARLRLPGDGEGLRHATEWDLIGTQSPALAAAALAGLEARDFKALVQAAVDFEALLGEMTWISPFRARKRAAHADVALGWSLLWLALVLGPTDDWLRMRVSAYLASARFGGSDTVRSTLGRVMDLRVEEPDDED